MLLAAAVVTMFGFAMHGYCLYSIVDEGESAHPRRHMFFALLLWTCAGYLAYLILAYYLPRTLFSAAPWEHTVHMGLLMGIATGCVVAYLAYLSKTLHQKRRPATVFQFSLAAGALALSTQHLQLIMPGAINIPHQIPFGFFWLVWVMCLAVYFRKRMTGKKRRSTQPTESPTQEA